MEWFQHNLCEHFLKEKKPLCSHAFRDFLWSFSLFKKTSDPIWKVHLQATRKTFEP